MSTSPSWFDQEKFSRLVKKVGPKPAPEAVPGQPGEPAENVASTARISLVSKPPSLFSERRALPALPRRTSPLPSMKRPFSTSPQPTPPVQAPSVETNNSTSNGPSAPVAATEAAHVSAEVKPEAAAPASEDASSPSEGGELAEVWQKMGQLNDELAYAIQERDQAINETNLLREQLRQALEAAIPKQSPAVSQNLSALMEERDRARRDYATIRKQYETLKLEQAPREESGKFRKELEQQVEGFRQKLEEKKQEIVVLKANSGGTGDEVTKLKQEVALLREQLSRAKDEASIAQRGLVLSQKALQETRDTLREATEGTSLSRHNFDNLKNECAILAQQNSVLQSQNDQLTRELSAAKSKLTTRL